MLSAIHTLFLVLAVMLSSACLLSEVRGFKWWLRAFDFPKLQLLALLLLVGIGVAATAPFTAVSGIVSLYLLAAAVHTGRHIWPYLPFAHKESRIATGDGERFSLIIANVQMENTQYQRMIDVALRHDADVILLIETDDGWQRAMQPLRDHYPHHIEHPNDTHSGLLLYSKVPLTETQIRYLVKSYIPSIRTRLKLPSGQEVVLYGVHPRPPRPENSSRGRDCELWVIGKEIQAMPETPVIVAGDLNDVGWSETTAHFQKMTHLLDPRRGRGFYNSYNAKYWFIRWPLDHLFHSAHFRVASLKRLPACGSDHFPLEITLEVAKSADKTKGV